VIKRSVDRSLSRVLILENQACYHSEMDSNYHSGGARFEFRPQTMCLGPAFLIYPRPFGMKQVSDSLLCKLAASCWFLAWLIVQL
jgi:hypothetical protein